MLLGLWKDTEKYKDVYWSKFESLYYPGDYAIKDSDGYLWLLGRSDDVLKVAGHRIGTAEVEDAINQDNKVIESAVVGFPHEIKGQGIFGFVIVKNQDDKTDYFNSIRNTVSKYIGPIAKPDKILVVPGLPKTRSGKIMRRILRKIASDEFNNFGDISTLLNPEIVDQIISSYKKLK